MSAQGVPFSLIVPVYKSAAYLPACVDSVLSQTVPDFELILVDDGSPDECPALCDKYALQDSRVRVLHQTNGGVVRARNSGLAAARGKYILFVDSDDTVSPRLLESLHACTCLGPDMIIHRHTTVTRDGEQESRLVFPSGYYDRKRIEKELWPRFISDDRDKMHEPGLPVFVWGKAFKKELLLSCMPQMQGLALGEDAALCFACVLQASSIYLLDEALYRYDKTNPAAATKAYRSDLPQQFSRLFDCMQRTVGGRHVDVDRQLNVYFATRVLRAVYIEVEHKTPVFQAVKRLREGFEETRLPQRVHLRGLPFFYRVFMWLLRLRAYRLILLFLKTLNGVKRLFQRKQA